MRPDSFDADANTIEIVWTTGASVRRFSWWDGEEYDEVLSLEPGAVRLDRLNAGAPFVDTHATYCLDNVIGSVVPGTAKIEGGRGVATILLSAAPGVADTVQKIREGVIRNISVGYWLHKVVKTEADDGSVARHDVVDWEPLEISAVPVPADAGSQIRSAEGEDGEAQMRSSCLIVTRSPASRPNTPATSETSMARTPKTAAPKGTRTAKSPAEIEAEKKRKAEERAAALRAAARDEDEDDKDEDERDEDAEEEREGDDDDGSDKGSDERSDDADADDETRDGDDDEDDDKDERSAGAATARRAAEKAVKAERVRSATITAMAERAGLPKLGRKHVEAGTSAKRFGDIVLERMLKAQEKRGNATLSGNGVEEIATERSAGRQGREQRELAEGEAHWRRVAGKPAKAA